MLTRSSHVACFSGLIAMFALAAPAAAQDAPHEVQTTAVLIPEPGATAAHLSYVNIGIRRGIRAIEGVSFRDPVDALDEVYDEEVSFQAERLDAIADQLRTGDAVDAVRDADEVIEIFENNLARVRRTQLVDAYMLAAIGRCRAGRTGECRDRVRDIVAFREGLTYDLERYGEEYAELFDIQKARAMAGPRGALRISTEPEGAEVYVDGRSYGPAPIRADNLLAGRHYVTLKVLGYLEQIVQVEVRPGREATQTFTLEPSANAARILSLRDRIREELGQTVLGDDTNSAANSMGTPQIILGQVRAGVGNQLNVHLYVYDVRTRSLQAQREGMVSADLAGIDLMRQLVVDLYSDVDLSGALVAPEEGPQIAGPQPELYEQWWFWTAILGGAALVGLVIGLGVEFGTNSGLPAPMVGTIRFQGLLPD